MSDPQARLIEVLERTPSLAIAVSGGVDSMTLAYLAHRHGHLRAIMAHAVSPSVPALATARIERYAKREGWRLVMIDAGEMDDPTYRSNPRDRCYYCKSCLYDRIFTRLGLPIASGTNLDDLDDYRPGLKAAAERGVVHPFVEAGIDKAGIRTLARRHGLDDISDLPAQPCLASRVETGIGIDAADLAFIDRVEQGLRPYLDAPHAALRCRITHQGVVVEMAGLGDGEAARIQAVAARMCAENGRGFQGVRPYRRGSAFLTGPTTPTDVRAVPAPPSRMPEAKCAIS